jgi:hypothetical protein
VTLIANIDASGIAVNDREARIARRYTPAQFPALGPIQAALFQPLESGHSLLRHAILLKSDYSDPKSDYSDPGSARLANEMTDSPAGSSRAFCKARAATNQCIATAEVMLKDGHKAPKRFRP